MESDADLGTPDGDRLDILATLVQAYEAKHVPITSPDPVEAIKFPMDQSGLSVKNLEPIIGKSNRVYEVLNRKRPLTLAMIRSLHQSLGIPADVLIVETVAGLWHRSRRAQKRYPAAPCVELSGPVDHRPLLQRELHLLFELSAAEAVSQSPGPPIEISTSPQRSPAQVGVQT